MTPDRHALSLGAAARAELDDLLIPLGFLSGQGGDSSHRVRDQVIYCTGYREFVERFPNVTPPYDYEDVPDHACLDLVIEGSMAGGITDVRFEGAPLDELLMEAGEGDAAAASAAWPGISVLDDLARVRHALVVLLGQVPGV